MNRDHVSIIGVLTTLALLVATGNGLWLAALFASSIYGGWRLGQHLIPAEAA